MSKNSLYSQSAMEHVQKHLEQYTKLISFWRFYPDLLLDYINTKGIKFNMSQRIYLRMLVRSKGLYSVVFRGYGKCVTGDTLIYTNQGVKEIGSLFNYQNNGKETIYDLDVDVINREGRQAHSPKGIYSGKKPTVKIITNEGYNLEGTYVHPILVMQENGFIDFKTLAELKKGDYVLINRNNNLWGNNILLNVAKQLEEWKANLSDISKKRIEISRFPTILNQDISYLLGILIGDGNLTNKGKISLTSIDDGIIDKFKQILIQDFKVKNTIYKNKISYVLVDLALRKYLELLGLGYEKAIDKKIPNCILEAPKDCVCKFLKGLFDTDGNALKNYISFCTSSKKLVEQVKILLLNLGITTSTVTRKSERESYELIIHADCLKLFNDNIGFSIFRKQKVLNDLLGKNKNTNKNIIPFQKDKIMSGYCGPVKLISHIKSGDNNLTYDRLKNIIQYYKDGNEEYYKQLLDTNYFYSQIKEIEYGEKDVYDISVPDTTSFISNGFISHNTFYEVLAGILYCLLYPTGSYAISAQTKENAASVTAAKVNQLLNMFPTLQNEVVKKKISKTMVEVFFKNGSKLD